MHLPFSHPSCLCATAVDSARKDAVHFPCGAFLTLNPKSRRRRRSGSKPVAEKRPKISGNRRLDALHTNVPVILGI